MTPILEIQKLSHIYSPDTPFEHAALRNVDLTICRGEFVGLIGHTGSGKSTLLKNVTSDYHYHTVTAEEERILDDVEAELAKRGYLVEQKKEELQ